MAETPPIIPATMEGVEVCEVDEISSEGDSVTAVDVAEVELCGDAAENVLELALLTEKRTVPVTAFVGTVRL